MARHLVEPARDMIVAFLRGNITAALQAVETDRNSVFNYGVPLPSPREYFISKNFLALQTPSVFVVAESGSFKKERGANHINGTAKFGIVAIVEAQTSDISTRMSDRYLAAFSQILDNLGLTSADNTFRIKLIAKEFEFAEDYTVSTDKGNQAYLWRKGFKLNMDVEFYEAL